MASRHSSRRRGISFPHFQSVGELVGHPSLLKSYMSERFAASSNLYRKNFRGHFGCVNAIEFSNNGGEFIVSGGDDRRVLLWNVDKTLYRQAEPEEMKGQHRSNIFCTVFDGDNRHLFSAGNDDQAVRHDILTGETLGVYFHDDPVYGLSVHPEQENVFLTACDNGKVQLWDARNTSAGSSQYIADYSSAFHAAVFNPLDSVLIATANSSKGIQLWDVRCPKRVLHQYNSAIPKLCAMGVKWNMTGTLLTALRRRLPPVLYSIEQTAALVEFEHPGYNNVCTMKSHCFAGDKDQYIISGSDDFNIYVWKIPDVSSSTSMEEPITVDRAFLVLSGHRSIVNQVRFNPATNMIISAGVEKLIKVWSPWNLPGGQGSIYKKETLSEPKRVLYTHDDYVNLVLDSGQPLTHEYEGGSIDEDPRMLAFFDSLIEREQRGWNSSESSISGDDFYTSFLGLRSSESSTDSDTDTASTRRTHILASESRNSDDESDLANSLAVLQRMRRIRRAAFLRGLQRAMETQESASGQENSPGYFLRHVSRELRREIEDGTSNDSHNNPRETRETVSSSDDSDEPIVSLALPDELPESPSNNETNSEPVAFRPTRVRERGRQYRIRRTRNSSSEGSSREDNDSTLKHNNVKITRGNSKRRQSSSSSSSSSSNSESNDDDDRHNQSRRSKRKQIKIQSESDNNEEECNTTDKTNDIFIDKNDSHCNEYMNSGDTENICLGSPKDQKEDTEETKEKSWSHNGQKPNTVHNHNSQTSNGHFTEGNCSTLGSVNNHSSLDCSDVCHPGGTTNDSQNDLYLLNEQKT